MTLLHKEKKLHLRPFMGGWIVHSRRLYQGEIVYLGSDAWPLAYIRDLPAMAGYFTWARFAKELEP